VFERTAMKTIEPERIFPTTLHRCVTVLTESITVVCDSRR